MENVYNLSLPPEWWVGTSWFFSQTFFCCLMNFELLTNLSSSNEYKKELYKRKRIALDLMPFFFLTRRKMYIKATSQKNDFYCCLRFSCNARNLTKEWEERDAMQCIESVN
jgi:hypothetical protein